MCVNVILDLRAQEDSALFCIDPRVQGFETLFL